MESDDLSSTHLDTSRPSLGFPLGTALLLIIIFSLSGIFSCCYHWEKLRSLRQSLSHNIDPEADIRESPPKPEFDSTDLRRSRGQSVPVLMPGDEIPKFIAMPCPCEPSRSESEKIVVRVEKPPPKPPRVPAPLY